MSCTPPPDVLFSILQSQARGKVSNRRVSLSVSLNRNIYWGNFVSHFWLSAIVFDKRLFMSNVNGFLELR